MVKQVMLLEVMFGVCSGIAATAGDTQITSEDFWQTSGGQLLTEIAEKNEGNKYYFPTNDELKILYSDAKRVKCGGANIVEDYLYSYLSEGDVETGGIPPEKDKLIISMVDTMYKVNKTAVS